MRLASDDDVERHIGSISASMRRDGFVRLPGLVPADLVERARRAWFASQARVTGAAQQVAAGADAEVLTSEVERLRRLGGQDEFVDLFNASPVLPVLTRMFGAEPLPVRGSQIAALSPGDDAHRTNEAGYLNSDTPHFGWAGHLDGLWNGGIRAPQVGKPFSKADERAWYGGRGTNTVPRYQPEFNANIRNFTTLVGVALSDQRRPGSGNLGLLRGAHRHMEAFFRWQDEQGGPLGPEGPGWPRERLEAPNGHGLVHYPPRVRARYRRGAEQSEDGWYWPKPTFMRVRPGDVVIVHFSTPHAASRVLRDEPRLMVYFRCTPVTRPEENRACYPPALLDNWLEWRGLPAP